jgi:AraC-like DNA-binding protein
VKYLVQKADLSQRGDPWQRAVSETYFPLDIEYRNKREFTGSLETWSLGIIGVSRMTCDGLLYRRHRRHFLNERDSSLLITIPELHEVNFSQGSRTTTCAPGGFLVERGDAPYEFWHAKANSLWVLKVPSASVRARIGSAERIGALNFDATQGVASYFLETVRTTMAHIERINEPAREAAGMYLLDMLCMSIRNDDGVLDSSTSSIRAAHLGRADRYIRDNLKRADLSPQAVAEACGISLRYLQRLFADGETSINTFIRETRLERCAEDLRAVASTSSVAEIAYRWGFTDQSQFCKHYKLRFGCTPTDTRKQAQIERLRST